MTIITVDRSQPITAHFFDPAVEDLQHLWPTVPRPLKEVIDLSLCSLVSTEGTGNEVHQRLIAEDQRPLDAWCLEACYRAEVENPGKAIPSHWRNRYICFDDTSFRKQVHPHHRYVGVLSVFHVPSAYTHWNGRERGADWFTPVY